MAEPKKEVAEVTAPVGPTSMAEGLEKLIGHKLKPDEIKKYEQKLSGAFSESENLEDLFADYIELVKEWSIETRGPAIGDVVQHVQDALRGFIPTGDGVVDETLTTIIGKLADIQQDSGKQLSATSEQWQEFYNLLRNIEDTVKDLSKASRVNAEKFETARKQIKRAIEAFQAEKAEAKLLTTPITIEEAAKPTPSI